MAANRASSTTGKPHRQSRLRRGVAVEAPDPSASGRSRNTASDDGASPVMGSATASGTSAAGGTSGVVEGEPSVEVGAVTRRTTDGDGSGGGWRNGAGGSASSWAAHTIEPALGQHGDDRRGHQVVERPPVDRSGPQVGARHLEARHLDAVELPPRG